MADFVAYLLSAENMLVVASAWVLISAAQRVAPSLERNRVWVRVLPVLPVALCSIGVWLPGIADGGPAEKTMLGLVLGAFSGQLFKVLKQTIFGDDKRISGNRAGL